MRHVKMPPLALKRPLAASLLLLAGACGGRAPAAGPVAAPLASAEAWRNERPAPGPSSSFDYPAAQVAHLDNGVELWLVPRASGTVALSIASRAGGASCAPGQSGLAALTLRAMTEATRSKPALALAEATEALGARLDVDVGRDGSSVSLEVLPSDADAGLGLLAEVITQPRFDAQDVARIEKQWLDSLVSERQEPARLSSLAGLRALLGSAAGAPVRGSIPDVERLGRSDLVRFHREQFVAQNLAVVAVGDLDMPRLRQMASAHLGQLPRLAPPAPPSFEVPPRANGPEVLIIDRPGAVQTALFAGQLFPARAAPGHEAREVLNNLFGGLFTSRLNQNLREEHAYTYGARSMAIATRRWGAFVAMSNVKTESTADALGQLRAELAELKAAPSSITQEELERSKVDLVHGLAASLEHVQRLLGDTSELYFDGLAPDYHQRYPALIRSVDALTAFREAERLEPERLLVVLVGDRAQIEPLLAAQGLGAALAPPELTE